MRRVVFPLVWLVELVFATAAALLLALWLWSGSEGSLATALRQAGPYVPAGQTLDWDGVTGSLRHGGRIENLRWSGDGLSVHAEDIRVRWQLLDLLRQRLRLTELQITRVTVDDRRPASEPQPPPESVLPLDVDLPFVIGTLQLKGANAIELQSLAGHYRYSDQHHRVKLDNLQLAQGRYQGQFALQARAPMALDLQLQGTLQAPVGDGRDIALDASATLRGALAGNNARLDLLAQIQPGAGNSGALAASRAMRASISGQLAPWARQPVIHAQASFNQLNLAALWPQAPRTLLTGNTWVRPLGASGWRAEVNLINRDAGPWDKGRLPLDAVKALVDYTTASGSWNVQSLTAEAGGGRVRMQGQLADAASISATSGWQGQVQLSGVDPAQLHSKMDPVRLDGELQARAAENGIVFDGELRPSAEQPRRSALRGLRLQSASANGRWADGWVYVEALKVQTNDARIEGRVDVALAGPSARGQLRLNAPGTSAQVSGQIAARDGRGELLLKVDDAAAARRWLARLPQMPAAVGTVDLRGNAELDLRWTGGWEAWRDPAAIAAAGTATRVQARLSANRLVWRAPGAQGADEELRLRDVSAELSGTPSELVFRSSAAMNRATASAEFATEGTAGLDRAGNWQGTVSRLQLDAADKAYPGPWKLRLRQPLAWSWRNEGGGSGQAARAAAPVLRIGAGNAVLTGPATGEATLAWQPVTWSSDGRGETVSKGELRGLPMAWLALFDPPQVREAAALRGDMVFDASWDVVLAQTLVIRAELARRSGDIRIQTDAVASASGTGAAGLVSAGVREARLSVVSEGENLRASLRWDSERAGNAQGEFSTRLVRSADAGWTWPEDSPISATLRAQMPQVGVWSMLAPPGWRVRGTVDANLSLSGTRARPQWNGLLQARDMAVRSVVDGIEFGDGRLRASLRGERLEIESFSLRGAGGAAAGGELTATGFATWSREAASGGPQGLSAITLQVDAVAKGLRVSARADRRLAVSGNLQAQLDRARLKIRGELTVDQALFILPDDTAPSLGDDVVVVGKGKAADPKAGGVPRSASSAPASATPTAARRANGGPGAGPAALDADLLVTLDLGNDFRVRGRGIDTRLAGELTLRSKLRPGESPQVSGELRTVGGQYRAYGQQLEIERGVMRFSGQYDNPSLDILAIRPKLSRKVGVQITGTALLPRVRLYAEPDLPEAEKLAWLVLGRSAAGGGAEAAVLQQAALALIGGQNQSGSFASRFGLDELSVSGVGDAASGGGAGAATVTLGKRISQNFYVAYERSLAGTLGTFSIFYDLSERFTLRARTGEKSAVDLLFTLEYD